MMDEETFIHFCASFLRILWEDALIGSSWHDDQQKIEIINSLFLLPNIFYSKSLHRKKRTMTKDVGHMSISSSLEIAFLSESRSRIIRNLFYLLVLGDIKARFYCSLCYHQRWSEQFIFLQISSKYSKKTFFGSSDDVQVVFLFLQRLIKIKQNIYNIDKLNMN